MIRRARMLIAGMAIAFLICPGASVLSQTSISDFEQTLSEICISDSGRCIAAIELGLAQTEFPSSEVLQFLDRLAVADTTILEKEALLLNIVIALEEGLPVDGLVTKGLEGFARGIALAEIQISLHQRLTLLTETRDLLYAKGIFSVAPGTPQSVPTALPTPRFNLLVNHVSDTIADYLDGGGSPFEGQTLYQEVRFRLLSLEGVTLLAEDVDLVVRRIEPADLTRVALSAVT